MTRHIGFTERIAPQLLALFAAMVCAASHAQSKLRLTTVATGLNHPWALAFLPDARMLVTERSGTMRLITLDGKVSAPVPGMPPVVAQGQGGLLDVALDPDFASNRTLYFSYSEADVQNQRNVGTAVARAELRDDKLVNLSVIFRQQPKVGGGLHFGSRIVVARDGTLFITLGERYQRERAQDLGTHFGKVIRINRDGSVPRDNPLLATVGARPEIWSYGHRNPQGATLHPVTGALWIHEHAARGGDEINLPEAGKNYGWPVINFGLDYSGAKIGETTAKAGMEQPLHYWDPSIAPSGMVFYTGDRYPTRPAWKGSLFIGALRGQMLVRLELKEGKVIREERLLTELGERIRDVRQGPDGYLYLLTDSANGRLLRLE